MGYIVSFFSYKKIFYRAVSIFSYWDSTSKFTKFSEIRRFAKLKNSSVGRYTRINPFCHLKNTTVGNFSAIGENTKIGLGRHPLHYVSTHSIFYKKNNLNNRWVSPIDFPDLAIDIGHDVWIGRDSTIIDGVKVGNGAVIGTRSVVTKDVPAFAVVAGCPAKIIKFRFSDDVIALLQDLAWWEFSDKEISDNIGLFRDSSLTVEKLRQYLPD